MERENRYTVLKNKDLFVLTRSQKEALSIIKLAVSKHRKDTGKGPLKCVVVESDWPEYEPTWETIEARVKGESLKRPLGDCGLCLPPRKMLLERITELENKNSEMLIVNSHLHEIMTELENRGIHITSKKCWCGPTVEGCPGNNDDAETAVCPKCKKDSMEVKGDSYACGECGYTPSYGEPEAE